MLTRSYLFLGLLWSFLLYAKATSVCVARLHSGDVFVNEGGAIATCAEYGATCALGSELDGEGGADSDGLQCGCDVSEVLVPCPACKCSTIYPVFNGTSCEGGRVTGWNFRNDLIDPHLNHSQALAMNKAFSYPTKVYGWKIRVKNSRSKGGWTLLQVWRPKLGGFNLIASTNFSYESSRGNGYTDTELLLNENERIEVDQGDIIGLFLPSGIKKSVAPFALGLLSGSVIASGVVTGSSDMLFFSTAANQDPPTELRTVDYDEHVTQFVINIQAMIGPPIEGEKQCLSQQASVETVNGGDTTPTSKSNLPLDVEYIRLIVVPIILILLFLILLSLGVGITILCVRGFASSRRKKAEREREERGSITLDTLDRRSVNNIYPPLGSLPRCTSPNARISCGVTTGSCADSLYETIPDLADRFTASCSGSLPHTYAILERPPLYSETCANTVPHFQFQEDVPADSDKSEKRLSTKDELTGQESEENKLSEQGMHVLVSEPSANGDYPVPREVEPIGGGVEESTMEREMEWEEVSDFDDDEDSDHGLKIYDV